MKSTLPASACTVGHGRTDALRFIVMPSPPWHLFVHEADATTGKVTDRSQIAIFFASEIHFIGLFGSVFLEGALILPIL